jgi:hypothetical protein
MPCYAMLNYAMLCYAKLCHAMLCYAMLCCRYDNLYKANKRLNRHVSILVTTNIGLCAPLTVFELLV